MAKIIFDIHWKELSDFTIEQAALMTMGIDPDDYVMTILGDGELANVPVEVTPEHYEIYEQKLYALNSGIRIGQLEVTEEHLDQYGRLNPAKTRIARTGLLAWWHQFGYTGAIHALATQAERKPSETNSGSAASPPAVALMQESLPHVTGEPSKLKYQKLASQERGCRMKILENWVNIENEYGAQAVGRQVHGFLRRNTDPADNVPSVKTVQNELKKLRTEGKIP